MLNVNEIVRPERLHTLSSLRKRLNVTQEEVADKLGISSTTLATWEKDSSNMKHYQAQFIAQTYSVSTEQIFFGDESAFNELMRRKGGF
ncbi:MAG: helix-turn-helix domain-containing protein [Streptococcaceae bacterium]|nr:helix-turn-helix domain-containing protein [Streptococcaceae bacterium]MCL2680869.1 helix-turn-helix domain-containing protein [Streptococcaceae bacterium]MCL2858066.1 helix-turn-helix domain-containing protein [Streptococcaceae bacterium]